MKYFRFGLTAGVLASVVLTTAAEASHKTVYHDTRAIAPSAKEWPVQSASDCPVTVIRRGFRSRVDLFCPRPPITRQGFNHHR